MEEQNEKPAKPCRTGPLLPAKAIVFTVVKVTILIFLIVLCATLQRLGRLHEGECIWVKDLCGVITEVSIALLKGQAVDTLVIKRMEESAEEDSTVRR
jgi:hypothetical protein